MSLFSSEDQVLYEMGLNPSDYKTQYGALDTSALLAAGIDLQKYNERVARANQFDQALRGEAQPATPFDNLIYTAPAPTPLTNNVPEYI